MVRKARSSLGFLCSLGPTESSQQKFDTKLPPGYNENWPSDITFSLNGVDIASWTSPVTSDRCTVF